MFMKKQELMLGENLQRKDDVQPVIEPEIIEPEIIEPEVVETDDVEKEGQGSRRPATWETEFQRWFGMPPFPLTAEKLAGLVRWIDARGPMQLGAFYPATLRKECGLLLPQPIYGVDDWRFSDLLTTWNWNYAFFKCRAIGDVLAYFAMARQNYENDEA